MTEFDKLEKRISYQFHNNALLKNALIHSSYASENAMKYEENNERLEFIGDAFLDAVVGKKIFDLKPSAREGELSKDRADVVCEESLADVARKINLGDFLLLGKGEEINKGSDKDSILSDAFEALIGAVIIDGGYDAAKEIIENLFKEKIDLAINGKLNNDYKSKLQEVLQAKYKQTKIIYKTISESGPDHDKIFDVQVLVNNKILGVGRGKSKIKAEQAAAKNALSKGDL